ncbi:hypothetical protein HK097_001180 [Rhizophlyctis rosea]|uniref:D-xylose 1-dehydrogenase (NADP(+), D-xylono-1,5-lactone-forming) n=1 Tax=Rhizophlyctis rosea TaxID=64517 RepID=A0AAD5WZ25_9FUNG|nr:hypothetical protein HK097_001180 [Rhizophlyctis rosea]
MPSTPSYTRQLRIFPQPNYPLPSKPQPKAPKRRMAVEKASTIRWGILGAGWISNKFARSIIVDPQSEDPNTPRHVITAIGSSSIEKGKAFIDPIYKDAGAEYTGAFYATYEELVADPNVDVVYIGTPHTRHHPDTLLCVRAGKHVLCEKPIAANHKQGKEMVEAAEAAGVFLMEAIWTRYFDAAIKVREIIAEGTIGQVEHVVADLSMNFNATDVKSRILNPELAGGALLDIGIYPLQWVNMILAPLNGGQDPKVSARFNKHPVTGVDITTSAVLEYEEAKALATINSSIMYASPSDVIVYGTKGRLFIEGPSYQAQKLRLKLNDSDDEQTFDFPYEGNGMRFEADEVARKIKEGVRESPVITLKESEQLLRIMDEIRRQGGLRYPFEV